jgi:DUF1680 family protein
MANAHPTPVDVADVAIDDDFWSPWVERNREEIIAYQYEQLEESGTLENFRRVIDGKSGGFQGMWFQDSDAYKWIEAASYVLASDDDPELEGWVDEVIELIAGAQEESGYIDTYFQLKESEQRWTNLNMLHELYCMGHLIEAAVAHYEATGKETLLDVARGVADHVDEVFPEEIDGVPGHEEIELALVRLARVTDEERYLDLAAYFVELRGRDDRLQWEFEHADEIAGDGWREGSLIEAARGAFYEDDEYVGSYAQAQAPLVDQEAVEGHSVRAMYFYAAATDLLHERDEPEWEAALDRLWENMTQKRMYVTGGIGSTEHGEQFNEDYNQHNDTTYAETSAAIGSVFWTQRMFERSPDAKYADLIERTLYNGFLVGVSLDGREYFYDNRLASDGDHHRTGWFQCACCPPNAARLFASLGRYLYARTDETVYVNQYIGSEATVEVGAETVDIEQDSTLPWEGSATLDVAADGEVTLALRVPEWTDEMTVDGDAVTADEDGYAHVAVSGEETLDLAFEQSVEQVVAHPQVAADAGKVAVTRGPLVYCAEAVDNDRPLDQYALPAGADIAASHDPDLLDGVTSLEADAEVPSSDGWEGSLYRPREETGTESASLTFVPYYAWDNREDGAMRVWIRAA